MMLINPDPETPSYCMEDYYPAEPCRGISHWASGPDITQIPGGAGQPGLNNTKSRNLQIGNKLAERLPLH